MRSRSGQAGFSGSTRRTEVYSTAIISAALKMLPIWLPLLRWVISSPFLRISQASTFGSLTSGLIPPNALCTLLS